MSQRTEIEAIPTERLIEILDEVREQRDIMQSNADELDRDCMVLESELERREYPATLF